MCVTNGRTNGRTWIYRILSAAGDPISFLKTNEPIPRKVRYRQTDGLINDNTMKRNISCFFLWKSNMATWLDDISPLPHLPLKIQNCPKLLFKLGKGLYIFTTTQYREGKHFLSFWWKSDIMARNDVISGTFYKIKKTLFVVEISYFVVSGIIRVCMENFHFIPTLNPLICPLTLNAK